MFDKIPSLRDFIVYVIPGMLISYFSLNILTDHFKIKDVLTTDNISQNIVLTFISIIFSFFIGFILSQFQIIIYGFFVENSITEIQQIKKLSISDDVKKELIERIQNTFSLKEMDKNHLEKDSKIFELCLNYVTIKGNGESSDTINRSKYLSTFSIASFLPIMLGLWNLMLKLSLSKCWWILYIILGLILIFLLHKIYNNFRKGWVENVYLQFYIYAKP